MVTPRRVFAFALAIVAGGACAVLAVLVHDGRFAHFDQHSVSHWMPWLEPPVHHSALEHAAGVETRSTTGGTLVSLVTYPASIAISGAITVLCATLLWRRRRQRAGVGLVLLWVAAN